MRWRGWARSALLWLCVGWASLSTHAAELTPETHELKLLGSVEFLEDPSGQLTIDDVRRPGTPFRRWSGGGEVLNFGFTTSAYWLRFPLRREAAAGADWLLAVSYPNVQELDFYAPGSAPVRTGTARSLASRPTFDRFFVLPLHVGTDTEFYHLRVSSQYALTVPLTVWQPRAFGEAQQRFHALQFIYYGVLLVMAIYGVVIYLGIRDARFAIYSAYIVTAGLGMLISNGYARLYLWPESPQLDDGAQTAVFSLAAFFAVRFARALLQTPDRTWLGRGLKLSQTVFWVSFAMTLLQLQFPPMLSLANQLLMLNSIVMGCLVSVASFQAYRTNRRGVRFFAWGWLVLWLGVTIGALRAFGWVPSKGLTTYPVQIATALEMLMVALALGDLLREEHQSNLNNEAIALQASRALLEVSQASEAKLKQAVAVRTYQLEAALQQEKQLREQYVRFGSMISHEFRTPLSIIQTQASLMRKEHEHGIDDVVKHLEAIGGAAQRMRVMFDKWLHSDELDQNLEILDLHPLLLPTWLDDMVQANPHLLLYHTVSVKADPSTPVVNADEYHLGLALTNLIDNAAKYSPPNTTITIATRRKPGFVGIAVSDEGPGIAQDIQDKVFDEFFRIDPESNIRGVGLGLSIVRRVTQAHGGHVQLSSPPGSGATFCIWLPEAQLLSSEM